MSEAYQVREGHYISALERLEAYILILYSIERWRVMSARPSSNEKVIFDDAPHKAARSAFRHVLSKLPDPTRISRGPECIVIYEFY
jgi:hypothetical protein